MELLEKQLVEKDKQIEKLQQSLGEAHKLLDQQQQLNLSTNRQNEKLLDAPQKTSEDASKDDTDVLEPTGDPLQGGRKLKRLKKAYSAG